MSTLYNENEIAFGDLSSEQQEYFIKFAEDKQVQCLIDDIWCDCPFIKRYNEVQYRIHLAYYLFK